MPWTNRFSKEDCKTAKDVNWGRIGSLAKVDVPPMVISAFPKKIAKEKSFDITVDVDDAAQKGRVMLKFPSGKKDETIEFSTVDPETAKKVRTAKKVIDGHFAETKKKFAQLAAVKGDYKKHKTELAGYAKLVSGGRLKFLQRSGMNKKIIALEKTIEKSLKSATKIEHEHDGWYIAGPRKGKSKILKDAGIEEKKLSADDQKYFDQILFQLSAECGKVKKVYKSDIYPALEILGRKAEGVRLALVKSGKTATKEIEVQLIEEMKIFKKSNEGAIVDLKAEKSENFLGDIKDKKKGPLLVERLQNAHLWKSYWDSNQGRVGRIPGLLATLEKNAKRMKKIVPDGMQKSGNIPKLYSNIDVIRDKLAKAVKKNQAILDSETKELAKYKP